MLHFRGLLNDFFRAARNKVGRNAKRDLKHEVTSERSYYFLSSAITSISTSASLGRPATATVARAGGLCAK